MRDLKVIVGDRRVFVTPHAVDRYIERVKPHLSVGAARVELAAVLRHAEIREVEWASRPGQECAVLADSICFPLQGVTLTSCLTRASVGDEIRAARNEHRPRQEVRRKRWTQGFSDRSKGRDRARRESRREKHQEFDG